MLKKRWANGRSLKKLNMLAEWSMQHATLITWPHRHSDWVETLNNIEACYINLTIAIQETEQVIILCFDAQHLERVRSLLSKKIALTHISLLILSTNDTWIRDYGPISCNKEGKPHWVDFSFNAWGEKYNYTLDDKVSQTLHQHPLFSDNSYTASPLHLEGGAIESNGEGTLLTTQHCLYERNAKQFSKAKVDEMLYEALGINHIIALDTGALPGDDTDGHIDTLARFCNPSTITYCSCDDPYHPGYTVLQKLQNELELKTKFELLPMVMPPGIKHRKGHWLPATYANFLIINEKVLAPTYSVHTDDAALQQLNNYFPNHTIEPIDCSALIVQNGSLHCATMQLTLP